MVDPLMSLNRKPRKKPPKHDWDKIQRELVARPPSEAVARTATQDWLKDTSNIQRLLEAVSCGLSVRRFCEDEGITYSPVQRRLSQDDLINLYHQAQEDQAEHLLGEMERITKALEGIGPNGEEMTRTEVVTGRDGKQTTVTVRDCMDPKAASVILDSIKWRLSKFNARRYSDRQVIEQHSFDHTKAHIEAIRELARRQPTARLTRTAQAMLDHQADTVPIVTKCQPLVTLVTQDQQDGTTQPDHPGVPTHSAHPASLGHPGVPSRTSSPTRLENEPQLAPEPAAGRLDGQGKG